MAGVADARPAVVVDLNSDLGEGFGVWRLGDDEAILALVTSANVACGFHAGDATIMRRTCESAVARGVTIGAHVSYRDLPGFGRRAMDVNPGELTNDVVYQIGALSACARAAGGRVAYVKPHGALYNRIVDDDEQAAAVVAAIQLVDPTLPILGLPGARVIELAAAAGIPTVTEAFADRAYDDSGRLVPRSRPGAVIHDPATVAARAVRLAVDRSVVSITGTEVTVDARSICLHGDTPGAVELARRVRAALAEAQVGVQAFA